MAHRSKRKRNGTKSMRSWNRVEDPARGRFAGGGMPARGRRYKRDRNKPTPE